MTVSLRDYQQSDLDAAVQLFDDGARRVTVQEPCGTGKTHTCAALIERYRGRSVIFVPTIALVEQTIRRLATLLDNVNFIAVCSDSTVIDGVDGTGDPDDVSGVSPALPAMVTTDADELRSMLNHLSGAVVTVSTYASSAVIAEATASPWDVLVADEAHRTVGLKGSTWAIPLDDKLIPATRRLFMTATTKNIVIEETDDDVELDVVSMDDVSVYGPQISALSWREAIDRGVLSDYEVAVIGIRESEIMDLVAEMEGDGQIVSAEQAAAQLALLRAQETHPDIRSVLAFHNRVADSQVWCEQLGELARVDGKFLTTVVHHIDAATGPMKRRKALDDLRRRGREMTVVSNCRVLGEGVDVPALDAVMFAAPRTAVNDLVQIVGRALRRHPDGSNRRALIILPVIESDRDVMSVDRKLVNSRYAFCWRLLASLAQIDEQVSATASSRLLDIQRTGATEQSDEDDRLISIDASWVAEGLSAAFEMRVLDKIASHHPVTAALLTEYVADTGSANPSPGVVVGPQDYPLGLRIRSARSDHARGKLSRKVEAMYESVPGFEWKPSPKRVVLSDEGYVALMESYVAETGIHGIHGKVKVADPTTGLMVPIGRKAGDWKWVRRLSPELRGRFDRVVGK